MPSLSLLPDSLLERITNLLQILLWGISCLDSRCTARRVNAVTVTELSTFSSPLSYEDFAALHIHESIISTKACPGIRCQSANSNDQDYELLSNGPLRTRLGSSDLFVTKEELWKGFSISCLGATKKARPPATVAARCLPNNLCHSI